MTITEALAEAKRRGLRTERVNLPSPTARPGIVVGQTPAAGSSVASSTVVWLESTVAMPTTTVAPSTTTTTVPATTTTAPRR